jgi:TOBE domain
VLIRPEQLELAGAGAGGPGLVGGKVIEYGYHGHDAVLRVQPGTNPGLPVLTVRTLGSGPAVTLGEHVVLRARGPVLSWTC